MSRENACKCCVVTSNVPILTACNVWYLYIISCRPIVLKFNVKITSAEGGLKDVDFFMNEIRIC